MREVRKRSIRIRNTTMLALLSLLSSEAFSQFSLPIENSDSLKTAQIKQFETNQDRITINGLTISRYDMPIFCKWELDIQDKTKFPVKFRLGSQDYVDRLEQKTNL